MLIWEQFYTQFKLTSNYVVQWQILSWVMKFNCFWEQDFFKKIYYPNGDTEFYVQLCAVVMTLSWFLIPQKVLSDELKYVQHCQVYLNLRFPIGLKIRNFANSTFLSHLLSIVDWWFMGTWNSKLVSKQTMRNEF